jgi:hypothetical protein
MDPHDPFLDLIERFDVPTIRFSARFANLDLHRV